jgi:hypothetical protein
MKIPAHVALQRLQRIDGRFFEIHELMVVLAIYYGTYRSYYRRTWQIRTLIATHREQHHGRAYSKGYGLDWKCLRWDETGVGGRRQVPDRGVSIKREVLEYAKVGKLPFKPGQRGAALVREYEIQLSWRLRRWLREFI